MKKIIFGITSLDIGGAEKVLVDLTNKLSDNYEITILSLYPNGDLTNNLNEKIKLITIFNKKYNDYNYITKKIIGIIFSFDIFLKLFYKKYVEPIYDIEIAFLEGPITSLFSVSKHPNKIAWVHTNISDHVKNRINKLQKQYNKYKRIIFVSQNSLEGFNKTLKNNSDKRVIYSYLNTNDIINKSNEYTINLNGDIPVFVSVCRLVKAKAIDRLVLVSKKLIDNGFNHKIHIVGDGPEKLYLEQLIKDNNLNNTFILEGYKSNPLPYVKSADYFILPSLYEGYGMVLVEAMCLNKSIITTDTGAKEAVLNYNNKVIVDNNEDALYDVMKKVITKEITFDTESNYQYNDNNNLDSIYKLLEEKI